MKIVDIKVGFEELDDGSHGLACRIKTDDGQDFGCAQLWNEPKSLQDAAVALRVFAATIENMQ